MRCPETPPTTLLPPMPIYEYRCLNGHTFEVIQSMSDDPVETCEVCGAPVERVFHPVAVHFKGSGFYSTDYKSKAKADAIEGRRRRLGRFRELYHRLVRLRVELEEVRFERVGQGDDQVQLRLGPR